MKVIENHIDTLRQLCEEYHVKSLYLFGSAARGEETDDSDLDFLVTFDIENIELLNSWNNYVDLKESLKVLFNKKIDLVSAKALKNPFVIQTINQDKRKVYG